MPSESSSGAKFEIGHVLFIDLVGYSKLLLDEQKDRLRQLTEIVRATPQVVKSINERLVRLPTGDGMALVFRHSSEEPAQCALEIARVLGEHREIQVRMGIHSGPVSEVTDVNDQTNIAGAGINIAQRVMDCGDAGHILLSKRVAEDLKQYTYWQPHLQDLGECEVKHGVRIGLANLFWDDVGNPSLPSKLRALRKRRTYTRWAAIIVGLVLLGAILATVALLMRKPQPQPPLAVNEKSIAVLPFANLSDEKANAYFAEGIQDEILTQLAKIGALKVISRVSTSRYASSPGNLPEIAQQLGVANILEGSVQKARDAVHVNVQLIRTATGEHLWAESYTRNLDDIFGVEGEVAGAIAEQLKAKLTGAEKESLTARATNNSAAYDAYLRGLAFATRTDNVRANEEKSIQEFEEAVRLDPGFALAWAHLSIQNSLVAFNFELTVGRRQAARYALAQATKLSPALVETELASAWYRYQVERDYEGAKTQFEAVRLRYPNISEASFALACIARRQGQWEQSRLLFAQAIELDPQNLNVLGEAGITDIAVRDAASSLRLLNRSRDLGDQSATTAACFALTYQLTGEIQRAQAELDRVEPAESDVVYLETAAKNAILLRKYDAAIALLRKHLEKPAAPGVAPSDLQNLLADLLRQSGETAAAEATYRKARESGEGEALLQPDNPEPVMSSAWAETWLGEKNAALTHAHRAVALLPASKDAFFGPVFEDTLARIEAHFGDKESALSAVQHLFTTPYAYPLTPALLRLDPDWDDLRGDPRFEKLCQETTK